MLRVLLIVVLSFFLYSCAFDNSSVIKRLDLLEQKINFNSQRIKNNSERIDENEKKIASIEVQIEKIKKRLAKERAKVNFLAQIPPATVIDNLTGNGRRKAKCVSDKKVVVKNVKIKPAILDDKKKTSGLALKNNSTKKTFANPREGNVEKGNKNGELSPNQLYKRALSFYFKGDFNSAARLFKSFLNRFSRNNPLYDNSMYWLAYCYIHENKIDRAIALLNKLIEEFPYSSLDKGGKTDAAIFTLIRLYKKMGKSSEIRHYRELLIKRFPLSKYADYLKRRSG